MSIKSALFAVATTGVLIVALGSEWMFENATDGDFAQGTRRSVVGLFQFRFWDMDSDLRTATIVRLVVLVLLTGLLGGIVGRARPAAAFVGGWGAFLAAAVVSSGVFALVAGDAGFAPGTDAVDDFTLMAAAGTPAGMWLGWLVGVAVMLGSLGGDRAPTGRPAPAPAPWNPASPPAPAYDPHQPGAFGAPPPFGGTPPAAPAPAPSPPPPPPVIGTPPDRTQVFGEPPRDG